MAGNSSDPSSSGRNVSPTKESAADPTPTAPKKKSMASKLDPLFAKLPSWLTTAAKDPRKWKTFVRCMVCLFANLVLLVCQPSKFTFLQYTSCSTKLIPRPTGLQSAGQAGFFGLIVACILPPYVPLSVFIFLMLTVIVGMCLGWAWGVAAMAAALKARNRTLLASQYTRAQANLQPSGTNPDAQCK